MTIDELNAVIDADEIGDFILVCEARQVKALSRIADAITANPNLRLVLLAGPSSSGKTTTAKRLVTQLAVNGRKAMIVSTDDYFVGDRRNPRDEDGELDYEHVDCVDRERLAKDMNALMRGEDVVMRKFDFAAHEGYDDSKSTRLPAGGIVILEGIHALNPRLTEGITDGCKYRIYIEPRTQVVVFAASRLPPADGRLLRRLVRDNRYRKMNPIETFRLWPKVRAGERKWIEPFAAGADAFFDSGLEYELSVLKRYVAGLLEKVRLKMPEEAKAEVLALLLRAVRDADPMKVPGDSILRETIGGSLLEY